MKNEIQKILETSKTIAIVGASKNEKKDSYVLILNKKKYPIQIKETEKDIIQINYKNSIFKIKSSWKGTEGLVEV